MSKDPRYWFLLLAVGLQAGYAWINSLEIKALRERLNQQGDWLSDHTNRINRIESKGK